MHFLFTVFSEFTKQLLSNFEELYRKNRKNTQYTRSRGLCQPDQIGDGPR